jgi:type III secretion protein N (ATPase)
MLIAKLPLARVGAGVRICARDGHRLGGEIVGLGRFGVTIAPFGDLRGVARGDPVALEPRELDVVLGYAALGRAIDATGAPFDGGAPLVGTRVRTGGVAPLPAERAAVSEPFWSGVRAIDGLLTIGRGARIGLFGAPGAGKSTLLESIARGSNGDAVVIALVGERGREAATWLARLDERTTIVCATSDRSAAERIRAAEVAMAHATVLRARGLHVVLIVDSLARYAGALRELRVANGEPVGRGGYPPGVFSDLAHFLERAGNERGGSITMVATVLVDGADEREPVADAARAILDGHVVLSSELAHRGHHPAIDVLSSASRTMNDVVRQTHAESAVRVRRALARLDETRDLRTLGLTTESDVELTQAIAAASAIEDFLVQRSELATQPAQTVASLERLASLLEAESHAAE